MHEMSIAQNILDIVHEEMVRHQVRRLKAINLAVGRLSAVVPASLTFCFGVLTEGTDLAETALNIRLVPLGYRCADCGREFTAEEPALVCPQCNADKLDLIGGRELTIEDIEAFD